MGKKQRADLFSDLKRIRASGEDHFMATIVGLFRKTEEKKIGADQFMVVEIVDGQQRLTTLIILLKTIQMALDPSIPDQGRIREELARLLVKDDEHTLLLLQTNHDTSHLFADYIREGATPDKEPSTSADENLINAIVDSQTFVSEWMQETPLTDLIFTLRHRLWVIFHAVEEEGLVYRVFEVLNSRGLDVASIDKLKSQLMGLVFENGHDRNRDEAIREIHHIWQDIYRTLGAQKFPATETLRFAATLRASDAMHRRPLDEQKSLDTLIALAGVRPKQALDCANWLRAVVEAEDKILARSRLRAVTGVLQARLVAVAILLRHFTLDEETRLLKKWENVTFRIYGLADEDARTKVGEYTSLAWEIINNKLSPAAVQKGLESIGSAYLISRVMDEQFSPKNAYEGWTEKLRYFLFRYEEYLAGKQGQKINESAWNRIWSVEPSKSIEHIKPRSSRMRYVDDLGNLMMLPPGVNSKLQDQDPTKKAETYRTCGLLSSVEVAGLIQREPWNKTAVDARTKELMAFARNEWTE